MQSVIYALKSLMKMLKEIIIVFSLYDVFYVSSEEAYRPVLNL